MSDSADHEREPPPLLACGIALSIGLGAFAVYGWLLSGKILGGEEWRPQSGVFALYAYLAIVMQVTAAVAAMSARWAHGFGFRGSEHWARAVVGAAGLWNAFSLHNAFHQGMPEDADLWAQGLAWIVSAAVAFVEIAVYWIDETLKSEVVRRRRKDEDEALARARGEYIAPDRPEEIDHVSLTDEAIEAGISAHTGAKRKLESERARRRAARKQLTK